MGCKFKEKCWRYAYTQYQKKIGYTHPPDRLTLLLVGCASQNMISDKNDDRIYCQLMPQKNNVNHCPSPNTTRCKEFQYEEARLERAKKKPVRKKYGNYRCVIPADVRKLVAAKAKFKCQYCGISNQGGKIKTCVDHIVPLAKGGHPTDISNLALACMSCNQKKGVEIWELGSKKR